MDGGYINNLMHTLYASLRTMGRVTLCFVSLIVFVHSSLFAFLKTDTIQNNSLLYSGFEYTRGLVLFGESPFYLGSDPFKGAVKYQGNFYSVQELQYDCHNDVLVTKDRIGDLSVELIKEKIEEFNIGDHHFDKLKIQGKQGEFYERVHVGKRSLYIQWQKKIVSNRVDEKRYQLFGNVYILNSKDTIRINKVSDYFELLGENQNKIKRYYKEQHLKFRKDPLVAMETMVKKAEAEEW
jgi:hypothetical protein